MSVAHNYVLTCAEDELLIEAARTADDAERLAVALAERDGFTGSVVLVVGPAVDGTDAGRAWLPSRAGAMREASA